MLSLRTTFSVCACIFALIVGLPVLGNYGQASGLHIGGWSLLGIRIVVIGLTIALAFAFVPLMVNVVFGAQLALGNEARLAPLFALKATIIVALWILMGAGAIVAVIGAATSGAFGNLGARLGAHGAPASGEFLVAGIGMTVDDVRHASTYAFAGDAGRNPRFRKVGRVLIFGPPEQRAFSAAAMCMSSISTKRGGPWGSTYRSSPIRWMGRHRSEY